MRSIRSLAPGAGQVTGVQDGDRGHPVHDREGLAVEGAGSDVEELAAETPYVVAKRHCRVLAELPGG
jgi:hypothetical protein